MKEKEIYDLHEVIEILGLDVDEILKLVDEVEEEY